MKLKPSLAHLTAYRAGPGLEEIRRRYGLDRVVKLASNESPDEPFPEVVEAVTAGFATVNRYPDGQCGILRTELAEQLGIEEAQLIFGNGSCEILMLLGEALLSEDTHLVYPHPSFVMYETIAKANEAAHTPVVLREHVHDLDAMVSAIRPNTALVIICNPNNPSGTYLSPERLDSFMAAVPEDTVVALDEAYIEFVTPPATDAALELLAAHRNLIVLRTFSKIYGLAGLRVGYGICHLELVEALDKVRQPFNVNSVAQVAAAEALRHPQRMVERRTHVAQERTRLGEALEALGVPYVPSQANFMLVDVQNLTVPAEEVPQAFLERGVMTRSGFALGYPGWIRVSIGSREENDLFLETLQGAAREGRGRAR